MTSEVFPNSEHDHHRCINDAMLSAERFCHTSGLRLTPVRRRVLELIWQSHCPSGAYGLLEKLAEDGHKPSPPTVYRALEFLLQHGLIHKVSSLNAYVGCNHPGALHAAQIFICERCGVAVEQRDSLLDQRIHHAARELDFHIHHQTVEVSGLCPLCQATPDED